MEAVRHVMLEVRGGPESLRRFVLAPGKSARVGRTQLADLVIDDDQLSAVHFELSWDGQRCSLRDLGSAKGTLLGGAPTAEGAVSSGDWIRAGITDLMVYFEGDSPAPPSKSPASAEGRRAALATLARAAEGGPLYALLDAARDGRVLTLLRESVDEYDSLYQGLTAETMADYAPYLVLLRPGSRLLPRLVEEGLGDAWGVFLGSRAPLREVRSHFRKHLFVNQEESEQPVYFRFYDPRVLRAFHPTCTLRQEDMFFGPVEFFLCEDEHHVLRTLRRRAAAQGAS